MTKYVIFFHSHYLFIIIEMMKIFLLNDALQKLNKKIKKQKLLSNRITNYQYCFDGNDVTIRASTYNIILVIIDCGSSYALV